MFRAVVELVNKQARRRGKPSIHIKVDTLRSRYYRTHAPAHRAHASQQKLAPEVEEVLLQWLHFFSLIGEPADKDTVCELAKTLSGKYIGKNWVDRFFERNDTDICAGTARNLDPKRARAFNETVVNKHFDVVEGLVEVFNIKPENLYNSDEHGTQRGGGRRIGNKKYAMPPEMKGKQYKISGESLELTTIIECICADGTALKPMFIFASAVLEIAWEELDGRITFGHSDNGWTDDELGLDWFRKCFIPQATARRSSPDEYILLVLDGHSSHRTVELNTLAREHKIIVYGLPPHTTHKLQPLDVGVFGPLKRKWSETCNQYTQLHHQNMPHDQFVHEYLKLREKSLTREVIQRAFADCGLWPLDRTVFTKADFGPSQLSSTRARVVPPTYPTKPPSESLILAASGSNSDVPGSILATTELTGVSTTGNNLLESVSVDERAESICSSMPINTLPLSSSPSPAPISPSTPPNAMHPACPGVSPSSPTDSQSHSAPFRPPLADIHNLPPRRPPPPSSPVAEAHFPPVDELGSLRQEVAELKGRIRELETERNVLAAHCVLSEANTASWKRKALERESVRAPTKRRRLNRSYGRVWTADEAHQELVDEAAEKAQRLAVKEAKERERQDKERQQIERRVLQEHYQSVFSGRLQTMSREQLQDVAFALKLSTDGKKKDILDRIRATFKKEPPLWNHPRFAGLYDPELPDMKERASRARRRPRASRKIEEAALEDEEVGEENVEPTAITEQHDNLGWSQPSIVDIQQPLPSTAPPHPSAYSMYPAL